jgi:outer membrane protein assembly factor BamB
MARITALFLLTACVSLNSGLSTEIEDSTSSQWPQFRGPDGNGVATQPHPSQWSASKNLAWSADIVGGGWSSPVAAGDRVFVTTAVSSEFAGPKGFGEGVSSMRSFFGSKPPQEPISFEVHCLSLSDGKLLWKQQVVSRKPAHKIHPSNSYATESPATDGLHIYAYFAAVGVVACLDLDGKVVWTRDIGAYPTSSDFGTGSSLALLDGHLFIQCDNERNSFLCALDTKSGDDVWRVERTGGTSWSSPVIWKNRHRQELVVCGAGNVTSYEPLTGKVVWELSGTGGAFSASPALDADRIYFGNSGRTSRGPLIAVNAGAAGRLSLDSISDKGVAWVARTAAPGMCSPVVVSGRLYVLSRGILSCHDAESGERLYRSRVPDASSVTASLWAAGENLYALNESGETAVIEIGDQFKLVRSNEMPGLYWSTPSVIGDALLIREASKLHCLRK